MSSEPRTPHSPLLSTRDADVSPAGNSEYAEPQALSEGSPGGVASDDHVVPITPADQHLAEEPITTTTMLPAEDDVHNATITSAAPLPTAEETRIKELELENYNLTLRLSRREKECDGFRSEVETSSQKIRDLSNQIEAEISSREGLEAQIQANALGGDEQVKGLNDRIAQLEKKLKEKKTTKSDSKLTARISELEKELAATKDRNITSTTTATQPSAELKKANAEILHLRSLLQKEVSNDPQQQRSSKGISEAVLPPQRHPSKSSDRHNATTPCAPSPSQQSSVGKRGASLTQPSSTPDQTPFTPGENVLAWWEPGTEPSPRGWANDAPGWYPAVVNALCSATHISVGFGVGGPVCTLPRCNVRKAGMQGPKEAGQIAAQLLEKNSWVAKSQTDPGRAEAAARHILQSEGINVPVQSSPPRMQSVGSTRHDTSPSRLRGVSSQKDATALAAQLVSHTQGSPRGGVRGGSGAAYTVLGQLSATEAEAAARRILEWELAGARQGSASPRGASQGGGQRRSMSPMHRRAGY